MLALGFSGPVTAHTPRGERADGRDRHATLPNAWAKSEHLADGRRVIDQEWAQVKLAECKARVRFLDLFNWKVAYNLPYNKALNPASEMPPSAASSQP